jgi:hypothetical protein
MRSRLVAPIVAGFSGGPPVWYSSGPFGRLHIAHRSRIKSRSCEIHVAIDYSERTSANHLQHTIFAGLNDL